jgi:hypothetical protein
MVFCLLYSQIWQRLPTDTSCLHCKFLSFLLVFGLGCALSKYCLLSWTKEFRGRGLCSNHMEASVTFLCLSCNVLCINYVDANWIVCLLSQSRWVLHWSGELLCLFSCARDEHCTLSGQLCAFLVCPGCKYIHVYSYSRSFEYHWQGDLIKLFCCLKNVNNL